MCGWHYIIGKQGGQIECEARLHYQLSDLHAKACEKPDIGNLLGSNSIPSSEGTHNLPPLHNKGSSSVWKCSPIFFLKGTELDERIKSFEERMKVKDFKVGVLYCKEGQISEREIFDNGNLASSIRFTSPAHQQQM